MSKPQGFVAIDFGTSNSAVALPRGDGGVRLIELEPGQPTMPTAVFYRADTPPQQLEPDRLYGRAAVAAYIEGVDGRLMRSMKSIWVPACWTKHRHRWRPGREVPGRVVGYLRYLKALC